jgi:AbrB family looped-hinge helix DNA binding protein
MTVTVTSKGQVTVPKQVRDRLGIKPGSTVDFEVAEDGRAFLRGVGVYYSSENPHVAIAELCFHRLLFFSESPETKWPANAGEYTAFAVEYAAVSSIDLTRPPLDSRSAVWMHTTRYNECQQLAELARTVDVELIKYASVRDPRHRPNIAILSCTAFSSIEPRARQTWRLLLGSQGARALCEMPRETFDFERRAFEADPRIKAMRWDR